jgi:hypothetical protein
MPNRTEMYHAKAEAYDKGGKQLVESKATDRTLGDAASFAVGLLLARLPPSVQFARIIVEVERQP